MYEIGSPTGVLTYVSVGVASKLQEDMVNISNKLSEYRKNRSKMDLILNKYEELDKGKQIQKKFNLKLDSLPNRDEI